MLIPDDIKSYSFFVISLQKNSTQHKDISDVKVEHFELKQQSLKNDACNYHIICAIITILAIIARFLINIV